ncbi:MAG: hypothetical protein JWQ23_2375 [Herminiimonas sp.]|nr:hypothetical protein [Herminiimonas sp.]
MTAFEPEFPVGEHVLPAMVSHEGEEVLYLLDGKLEFLIGNDIVLMERGDCIHFKCERPHMGRNIGSKIARLLMVVSSGTPIKRRFTGTGKDS